jgi:hypothetical protein
MEPSDISPVVAGVVVVGAAVVGTIVAGPVGTIVAGPVGTIVAGPVGGLLAGGAAATLLCLKKQEEEQSQLRNRREKSRESNHDHPPSSTVQTPPIQREQQTTYREEPRQSYPNPPSPPTQRITKQYLVLVVSASQADLLESLQTKRQIDFSDGEALYEITRYLWLGSETDFAPRKASINSSTVSEGEESEYDIYLVYIELNQADEGFKPNVNQLDRYDAFRNLDNLAGKFEISPRLQMEAYGNFDVYNR